MSKFNVEVNEGSGERTYLLQGHIDEDTNFQGIELNGADQLVFDFDKVSAINSCGIREWINWIKSAEQNQKIVYKNCPKIIVDQANMVAGFVPDNATVQSFYVPYYCESTDNEKMVLFTSGKEFKGSEVNPPEDVVDDESGEEMEMDIIEAKYFKFLK